MSAPDLPYRDLEVDGGTVPSEDIRAFTVVFFS